jgi:hypothetical protein
MSPTLHTTTPSIVEKEFVEVRVAVRAPCPDPETYAAVTAARPVPLRDQAAPSTEAERYLAERRQLGLYERPDGWADQVSAVMARCFVEGVDSGESLEPSG